ncbi:hypothetical protein HII31_10461 [Pseudocercospora fuligena]|uniref:DUF6594 domain-containing protein n=1 Tax=Pseudocercospora fuligena TaxID=685502 RepID=A0A8H6R8Y2_9PEZI|nr:hypothetical protein HII31_10461 [Pseudocercospora fuligena]
MSESAGNSLSIMERGEVPASAEQKSEKVVEVQASDQDDSGAGEDHTVGMQRSNTRSSALMRRIEKLRFQVLIGRFRDQEQECPEPTSFENAVEHALWHMREKVRMRGKPLPGYPEMAIFLGSDERLMMCRRFATIQARLLLEKQAEMRELEEKLEAFDRDDFNKNEIGRDVDPTRPARLTSRYRRDEKERDARQAFFDRLETKFLEYEKLVSAVNRMMSLEKPASYERKNVKQFAEERKPLVTEELEWIMDDQYTQDIVTLRGARLNGYLVARFETFVNKLVSALKSSGGNMRDWIERNSQAGKLASQVGMGILILLVPIMFVVPVYILSLYGENTGKSIGILIAFALAFAGLLAGGTPAKPHEVLNGSAAYLAVLVVFFGSVGSNRN